MSSNLANFWRSYVHIGVVTYSMGALAVILYAVATPSGPHRRAMAILGCLSLAASIGPFKWLGLRLVSTRWSTAFFAGWAACTFVFIALGAVLDGGVRSPISYFLVLPMLFAGLAYSAGTVSLLAAFGVVTTAVVGVLTPHRTWSGAAFLAVTVVIAGVIMAAVALNRDRLMGQLMEAASVDSLTGCLSRGAFQERLEHEAKRSWRHHSSFSLIVADVDNLKSLNDSSGHDSGDRALRLLVSVLCQAARESDVVGRLGGDEFALLLLDTDQDTALIAATRLNEALQAVTGSDSVTASLGVSSWLGAHDSPDALLRRADEALYVAKRAGRNRAALWEPSMSEAQAGLPRLGRRPRRATAATHRP
jgi:diguanylate cyclase (GGDEF)-like protein